MTEAEWLTASDPAAMVAFVRGQKAQRKVRLLGCACVDLVWSRTGQQPLPTVRKAEEFADGLATKAALRRARQEVRKERHEMEASRAVVRPIWAALWLAEVVASENASGSILSELTRLGID